MQSLSATDNWFDPDIRKLRNGWAGQVTIETAPNSFIQFSTQSNTNPDEVLARLEQVVVETLMFTQRIGAGRRAYDGMGILGRMEWPAYGRRKEGYVPWTKENHI